MSAPLNVLFAGGGTGGHLYPAVAVAEAVQQLYPGSAVHFAGTAGRIESRVVPSLGYPFYPIWISGFRRKLSLATALLPLKVLVSLVQAWRLLRRVKPDVVVGSGGYVSGPVVYTAAALRYPSLIQEQNEYPGATTRFLSARVDEVHTTFESSARYIPKAKRIVVSGNPVRLSMASVPAAEARRSFGLDEGRFTVFVFGGSQGAGSVNAALLKSIAALVDAGTQIIWQTGTNDYERVRQATESLRKSVQVLPYIDAINVAYSAADLVVCRAGATSLAEITVMGKPSILVPYPYAAADHQRKNARALEREGAALVIEDADADAIGKAVLALMRDTESLTRMAKHAAALARPEAAFDIARAAARIAEKGRKRR